MMMTLHALDSTFFALFLLLNLIVGLWYGRGVKSLRQYALGDRDFSTWVITMTIVATWMSGSALDYHVWEAYARGLVEGGLGMGLLALSLLLLALLALGAGEFLGQATLPEVLGKAYGSTVRRITALAGVLLCLAVVAMQFKIAGQALGGFLGLDQKKAAFALGALVIAYSSLGGIRSVVFTDVLQFLLLGLFLPILVLALWSTLPEEAHYVAPPAGATRLFTLRGDLLGDLLIVLIVPPLFQRLQMARDVYQARRAFGYAALVWGLLSLFMLLLAVVLRMAQPDLTSEQLLPYLVRRASFPGLRGLTVSALMAMVMSTADSYLNTAAVWVAQDLLGIPPRAPHGLWRVRGVALTLGSLGLGLALTDYGYGELQSVVISLSSALVLVPLLLHLVGFRSSQRAVLSGMSAGFLAFLLTGFLQLNPLGDNALAGILAHLLTLLGVHYLLGEAGGWVGVQEQEPLQQAAILRAHRRLRRWEAWASFRWPLFLEAQQPPHEGWYFLVGLYALLGNFLATFLVGKAHIARYTLPFSVLLVTLLGSATLLMTYPAWPGFMRRKPLAHYGYPLLVGYLFAVVSPLLFRLTGGSHVVLLLCLINLLMALTLFDRRLVAGGYGAALPLAALLFKAGWGGPLCPPISWLEGALALWVIASAIWALLSYQAQQEEAAEHIKISEGAAEEALTQLDELRTQHNRLYQEVVPFKKLHRKRMESMLNTIDMRAGENNKAGIRLLRKHIGHETDFIDKRLEQVLLHVTMQHEAYPMSVFLRSLEGYLRSRTGIPEVVTQEQSTCPTLLCDKYRVYQLMAKLARSLPQAPHKALFITTHDTTLSYPAPSHRSVPAVAFTLRQGLGAYPLTEKIAPCYVHVEHPVDVKKEAIAHTVEAHYGYWEMDPSGQAGLVVLPCNLKSIRPKVTQEAPDKPLTLAERRYARQVETNFWVKACEISTLNPYAVALALDFMKRRHAHVKRKSGEPFYTHPLIVATKVMAFSQDEEVIIGALLHDIVEDTTTFPEEVGAGFGFRVHAMVKALSSMRFGRKKYTLKEKQEQARYLRECGNEDAQLIKLCDRLHNMETLEAMREDKRVQKAQETVDYFIPLALQIGYPQIAVELTDLVRVYLAPTLPKGQGGVG